MNRGRGRRLAGLAVIILLAAATGTSVGASGDDEWWIVIRDGPGDELARTPLPASSELSLRYRNSLYGSLAEEHFVVEDGRLSLVALAADELAVLEEYYTAVGGARSDSADQLRWRIDVERPAIELPLHIRATALGERTLIAAGREIPLWRLVADREATLVTLSVERSR